jgi:hypothetical protein
LHVPLRIEVWLQSMVFSSLEACLQTSAQNVKVLIARICRKSTAMANAIQICNLRELTVEVQHPKLKMYVCGLVSESRGKDNSFF